MTGTRKIAIFLLTLKGHLSGDIFKKLDEKEQERVLVEIAAPKPISPEDRSQVLDEFLEQIQSQGLYITGGMGQAEELLKMAFGSQQTARDMSEKLQSTLEDRPFSMFNEAEPSDIYSFIAGESPQTIALILSYIIPDKAGVALEMFPVRKRNQIANKIANMTAMSPEAVSEVEATLKTRFQSASGQPKETKDGAEILAKLLTKSSREAADSVLENVEQRSPAIAERVRENMFTFEDITLIDDMAFRNDIIRLPSVSEHLAVALKGASVEAQGKFLNNMADKMKSRVQSQLDDLGPQKARDVAEAQRAILDEIRALEDSGKITISREEEAMVG